MNVTVDVRIRLPEEMQQSVQSETLAQLIGPRVTTSLERLEFKLPDDDMFPVWDRARKLMRDPLVLGVQITLEKDSG